MIKEWLSRFFPLDCKCTSMHGIGLRESKRVAVGGSDKERCELTENGIRPQPEGTWLTLCALYVIPTPFNIIWQWPIHPTTNLKYLSKGTITLHPLNLHHTNLLDKESLLCSYSHHPKAHIININIHIPSPQKGMQFVWFISKNFILAFYCFLTSFTKKTHTHTHPSTKVKSTPMLGW